MPGTLKYENNPEACGWTRRFIATEPRLSEAIELYRESGFDVLLVDFSLKEAVIDCIKNKGNAECFNGFEEKHKIIYTKPRNHPP